MLNHFTLNLRGGVFASAGLILPPPTEMEPEEGTLFVNGDILVPLQASLAHPSVNILAPGYAPWDDASLMVNTASSKLMQLEDDFSNLHGVEADIGSKGVGRAGNSSVNGIGSSSKILPSFEMPNQGQQVPVLHGIPDFSELYSFIGSVFDPDTKGHVEKLKEMDPINLEPMEKVHIMKLRCQEKVVGTIVTVAGAMLMTLYKGRVIDLVWSQASSSSGSNSNASHEVSDQDWLKGSILLILATLAWASFFIIQAITMRRYSAQLSLTALVCFFGTLQSIVVTFVMEHKPFAWTIGWDMNLLAAAYAGIASSSIAYYVQGLVMQKRWPVFVTAFSPLMMTIVAIMGSFIHAEKIYLEGVLGDFFIFMGLCAVLWEKYREYKEQEAEIISISEPINNTSIPDSYS